MLGRKVPLKRLPAGRRRDAWSSLGHRKLDRRCLSSVILNKAWGVTTEEERGQDSRAITPPTAYGARSDTYILQKGQQILSSEEYALFTTDILNQYCELRDMRTPRSHYPMNGGCSVATAEESIEEIMMLANAIDNPERNIPACHANAMSVYFHTNDIQNLPARDVYLPLTSNKKIKLTSAHIEQVLEYACATRNLALSDIQEAIRLANRLCQELNIDAFAQVEEFLVVLNPDYEPDLRPPDN